MSDISKVAHILGDIASEVELSDGTILKIKPATIGQLPAIGELAELAVGFLSPKTLSRKKNDPLQREMLARLGHLEADIMNAELDSPEMAEAERMKDILTAQLEALNISHNQGFATGFGRLVNEDAIPFLVANHQRLTGPIRALSGYEGTDDEFSRLPVADAALLLISVLVVNVDFFAQRLKPIGDALADLKNALFRPIKQNKMTDTNTTAPTGNS